MNDSVLVSKELESIFKAVDKKLELITGHRLGFSIIVYTGGRASYISNIDRRDATKELTKLLDLWSSGMPDVKAHEVS